MSTAPDPDPDPELASLVDRRLQSLPLLPAPRTLAANVAALLEARLAREWWRRAWWQWPVAAQGAFLLMTLALIAFASTGTWILSDGLATGSRLFGNHFAHLADWGQRFAPLADTGLSLAERFGSSLFVYVGILALFAYMAFLGAGTALARILWRQP